MINSYNLKKLGKLLKAKRSDKKLSTRDIAAMQSYSYGYVSAIERGEVSRPKIDYLTWCAGFYGLDLDYMIYLSGKVPPDVYWRLVSDPDLVQAIRGLEAKKNPPVTAG